jgi:hypothetical protein
VLPSGYWDFGFVPLLAALACLVLSIVWGFLARQWIFVSVVLGTIAVLVGMAFLQPPRHGHPSNDSAAVANLRTINTAEVTYREGLAGSYGTMTDLIAARLLDDTFSGTKAGYNYVITLGETGSEYTAEAVPASSTTGRYGYYSVVDAVVRYSTNALLAPPEQTGKSVQ